MAPRWTRGTLLAASLAASLAAAPRRPTAWEDEAAPPAEVEPTLAELVRRVEADPRDAPAWRLRAEIHRRHGDYADAFRSCLPLVELTPGLPADLCLCAASAHSFQAARSRRTLAEALARAPEAPAEQRLQALRTMAEIAAEAEDRAGAEAHLRAAAALDPRHAGVREDLAELLLGAGRLPEVLAATEAGPRRARLMLLRALAVRARDPGGDPVLERQLRARFALARATGDHAVEELEARFALEVAGDPRRALELARASWSHRRSPRAAGVFLEAARRAGSPQAARPVADWVRAARVRVPWLVRAVERQQVLR